MRDIAVIFGGMSVEREVSIVTGLQIVENSDKSLYRITPVYIDKYGDWYYGDKLSDIKIYSDWEKNRKKVKKFFPSLDKKDKKNILNKMSCCVIACHGNYGEDGKLQSLLEFLEIPYTSSGVVGSSSGMDKIVMKSVFNGIALPILPYVWFNREEWAFNQKEVINRIHYTLDYPVFVKPANLGSSIGISMANNEEELAKAIDVANKFDYRIIVEKGLVNPVEINCSGMFKNGQVITSVTEEPVRWDKFLSFQDKYLSSNNKGGKGLSSMGRKIPADVSKDILEKIETYTAQIYKTMDCNGVIRVDYILDELKEHLYVNEVNTVPGSMSFYLWEKTGFTFKTLITNIIEESIMQFKQRRDKILNYDSQLLTKITQNSSKLSASKLS